MAARQALVDRFGRGDLDAVVVASVTGATAVLVARALGDGARRLVCVADTPEWAAYGHSYPTLRPECHAELLERGARVLRDYRSSSAGMPRFDPATGRDAPLSPAEASLFWDGVSAVGGEGMKVAVKSVVLATDYGLLERGRPVASLGGAGDATVAIVMDAIPHAEVLAGRPGSRLRVREVLWWPGGVCRSSSSS